jgi:hypothetical protein
VACQVCVKLKIKIIYVFHARQVLQAARGRSIFSITLPLLLEKRSGAKKAQIKQRSSLKANCKMNLTQTGPFSLIAQQASPALPFFYYT